MTAHMPELTDRQVLLPIPLRVYQRDPETGAYTQDEDGRFVCLGETTVTVLAERTDNEHLFIHPEMGSDGGFNSYARFVLHHHPTGRSITTGGVGMCREVAAKVAHLSWGDLTDNAQLADRPDLTGPTRQLLRDLAFTNGPDDLTPPPAEEFWDGKGKPLHEITGATDLVRRLLRDLQASHKKIHGKDSVPFEVDDPTAERGKRINPDWTFWVYREVEDFGLVYLLAALQRIDPAAADSASRFLSNAWEAGDVIGEWAWQWHKEALRGQPLQLPGVPDDVPADSVLSTTT